MTLEGLCFQMIALAPLCFCKRQSVLGYQKEQDFPSSLFLPLSQMLSSGRLLCSQYQAARDPAPTWWRSDKNAAPQARVHCIDPVLVEEMTSHTRLRTAQNTGVYPARDIAVRVCLVPNSLPAVLGPKTRYFLSHAIFFVQASQLMRHRIQEILFFSSWNLIFQHHGKQK